jgi:hypothetical protein
MCQDADIQLSGWYGVICYDYKSANWCQLGSNILVVHEQQ